MMSGNNTNQKSEMIGRSEIQRVVSILTSIFSIIILFQVTPRNDRNHKLGMIGCSEIKKCLMYGL